MIQASYLKSGDEVRIIASARKISEAELKIAVNIFESWGLKVSFGDNLFEIEDQFAGTESQRASDLQNALDDKNVKAIIFARGGYGSVQILDQINWQEFSKNPKWLVGYSDITVFHSYLNRQLGVESLHAAMCLNLKEDGSGLSEEALESFQSALFGKGLQYQFGASTLNSAMDSEVSGELVGGNLSILYSLSGSNAQLDLDGKILFIEDLDEYLYHIDRIMMNLLRSGLFKGCKGVLIGGMSDMNDNTVPYGKTAEEIISHRLRELQIPLIFDFPAGHIIDNRALILGRRVTIQKQDDTLRLTFHERA